jgi:UDP-N-acetylmuramate dehydrogenase
MNIKSAPLNRRNLSSYTTIKIGGKAKEFLYPANLAQLSFLHQRFKGQYYLLGNGSNLLVSDGMLARPVIKLSGEFCRVAGPGDSLYAGGGALFAQVLKFCVAKQLSGLENLAGIPGTIGAMLAINASAYKRAISDCLVSVEVLGNRGKIQTIAASKIKFGYRCSSLQDKIILGASFRLMPSRFVGEKALDYFKERKKSQDYEHPSFGSVFKNPPGFFAARMIESCGLKGLRYNGAAISSKHANFIINLAHARCEDVEYLINKVKCEVVSKYNINLEEEVIRWI